MELFQIMSLFYTNWPSKMAASAVTRNRETIKQTISHELPNGFCQNLCHQCWKRPVARWPNAPNFCLWPPEISKFWTLVAQIYLSGNNKWMGSSAGGHFGPLKFWTIYLLGTTLILGVSSTVSYWSFLWVPNVKAQSRCGIAFRGILVS